jgi:hypothetical protein
MRFAHCAHPGPSAVTAAPGHIVETQNNVRDDGSIRRVRASCLVSITGHYRGGRANALLERFARVVSMDTYAWRGLETED